MKPSPMWAASWLLAATLAAQQDPPVPDAAPSAREQLEALQAEHKQALADHNARVRELSTKAKEAKDAGQPMPALPMRPDFGPLVAKAKAAAEKYAGTDDAVGFLVYVVRNGGNDRDTLRWAFECLVGANPDHPALLEIAPMLGSVTRSLDGDKADAVLGRFAASANADVRGWALLARHRAAIESADLAGDAYRSAKLALQAAAQDAANARLKHEIGTAIDLRERLGVGCTAPDIEGTDLDGVAFKLSDYRGKVVFLDFWGDW